MSMTEKEFAEQMEHTEWLNSLDDSGHTPGSLLTLAYAWSSISKDELVKAGVISEGPGGSDWKRFNDDPMTFIMKLPPERLPALCALLN